MAERFAFKRDAYRTKRGDYSRRLIIFCRKCNHSVMTYQKDGPGNLHRIYLDRIFTPLALRALQGRPLARIPPLACKNCRETLGVPYLYPKERRKAFRLFQDAVVKKVRKLN